MLHANVCLLCIYNDYLAGLSSLAFFFVSMAPNAPKHPPSLMKLNVIGCFCKEKSQPMLNKKISSPAKVCPFKVCIIAPNFGISQLFIV